MKDLTGSARLGPLGWADLARLFRSKCHKLTHTHALRSMVVDMTRSSNPNSVSLLIWKAWSLSSMSSRF